MEQKSDSMRKQRPAGYRPILLRVEASTDATPAEIAAGMCEHATASQLPLVLFWHGTDVEVWPGESAEQIVARMDVPAGTLPPPVMGRQERRPDYLRPPHGVSYAIPPERLPRAGTHVVQPGEPEEYEPGKIHTGMEEKMGEPGYTMGPSTEGPDQGITPRPEEHKEDEERKAQDEERKAAQQAPEGTLRSARVPTGTPAPTQPPEKSDKPDKP